MHVCVCVCVNIKFNQDKFDGMLDFLTIVLKGINMNVVHNLSLVLSKLLCKHIIMHTNIRDIIVPIFKK